MFRLAKYASFVLIVLMLNAAGAQAQLTLAQAWQELPHYAYGQDLAGQLLIERNVIEAMAAPEKRAEVAARLAGLLRQDDTTLAAKQFICLELRQVGTPAEIPVLAELLPSPDTWQMALYAMAAIPGPESLEVLRQALDQLQGPALVGAVNALAARRDPGCVARLTGLAAADDETVRWAALHALAGIADDQAVAWLRAQGAQQQRPLSRPWASCLLRAASLLAQRGDHEQALALYGELAAAQEHPATRRAALEGRLRLEPTTASDTIGQWLAGDDAVAQQVAAAHLAGLPEDTLQALSARLLELPEVSSMALLDVLASRQNQSLVPLLEKMLESDVPATRLAGLRHLGALHDPATVPTLIDYLSADKQLSAVAQQSLAGMPRDVVGPALLTALQRKETREPVIAVLRELKYYEAIDPLVKIAAQTDPAVYGPALEGLRGIADPDETDIPRLMTLLFQAQPGTHRDEVEKTIAVVCEKLPADADRADPVLKTLADAEEARKVMCLPLLGRLGGAQARALIGTYLAAKDKGARESAVRALCNWPNAEVADQLLTLATGAGDKRHARWALRAYVRVISLPSERPANETLAMLQKIMQQAQENEDRALIIARAGTVRTMECVRWVAGYLDNAGLSQAACAALVELAHHRELRHPNMDEFGPILDKVAATSKDATVAERAKRYRLGL
jgi:HEAT repeat protein